MAGHFDLLRPQTVSWSDIALHQSSAALLLRCFATTTMEQCIPVKRRDHLGTIPCFAYLHPLDTMGRMEIAAQYRALKKEGRLQDALTLARREVSAVEPNTVAQLGKMLQRDLYGGGEPSAKPLRVFVAGQCTTTY